MKNKQKLEYYSFVIDFWCQLVTTFALYKSFILCTYKTSLVQAKDYIKEQYCAFRNELRSFSIQEKIA